MHGGFFNNIIGGTGGSSLGLSPALEGGVARVSDRARRPPLPRAQPQQVGTLLLGTSTRVYLGVYALYLESQRVYASMIIGGEATAIVYIHSWVLLKSDT